MPRCGFPKRPAAAPETSNGQTGALYISLNGATTKKKKAMRTSDSSCGRSVARNESIKRDRERVREGMSPVEFAIRLVFAGDCARNLAFTWETKRFDRDRTVFSRNSTSNRPRVPGNSLRWHPRLVRRANWTIVVRLGWTPRFVSGKGDERESIAPRMSTMTLACSSRRKPENYSDRQIFHGACITSAAPITIIRMDISNGHFNDDLDPDVG